MSTLFTESTDCLRNQCLVNPAPERLPRILKDPLWTPLSWLAKNTASTPGRGCRVNAVQARTGQEAIRKASKCVRRGGGALAIYLTLPGNSRVIVVLQIVLVGWVNVSNLRKVWNGLQELWRGAAAVTFAALHKLWLDFRRLYGDNATRKVAIYSTVFCFFTKKLNKKTDMMKVQMCCIFFDKSGRLFIGRKC